MTRRVLRGTLVLLGSFVAVVSGVALQQQPRFNHAQHAKLFVGCATCHAGIMQSGAPVFPPAAAPISRPTMAPP